MISSPVIADTGVLVAMLNRKDQWHRWAVDCSKRLPAPWSTCEAVLSEAFYLLADVPHGAEMLVKLAGIPGLLRFPFGFPPRSSEVLRTIIKYRDLPASFTDACLVQMASDIPGALVWTTDSDFQTYRLPGKKSIPTLHP
ncbi:MAG: PIN domain-containing protein [Verrucomicrobiae bacterium]